MIVETASASKATSVIVKTRPRVNVRRAGDQRPSWVSSAAEVAAARAWALGGSIVTSAIREGCRVGAAFVSDVHAANARPRSNVGRSRRDTPLTKTIGRDARSGGSKLASVHPWDA